MARVKDGTRHAARRKKVLKQAKGYFGSKHRLYKTAKEQVMHSLSYAYRDRRQKKRDFRKLWITRINAGCRANDISYSKFINGLSKAGIEINRKVLSEMAIADAEAFTSLVNVAKDALAGKEIKTEVAPVKKENVKVEKTVKAEKETKEEDLSKKTVAELRELAKAKGVQGVSTMKKAELLDALK
jgi:large subunit ribosomal protein L20